SVLRQEFNCDGELREESKTFGIKIPPGSLENKRFTFSREGNQHEGRIPGDVVFILAYEPHPVFQRIKEVDIEQVMWISEEESMVGLSREIETLDNELHLVKIEGFIRENEMIRIEGKGLPVEQNNDLKRGDMIVRFKILQDSTTTKVDLPLTLEEMLYGSIQ